MVFKIQFLKVMEFLILSRSLKRPLIQCHQEECKMEDFWESVITSLMNLQYAETSYMVDFEIAGQNISPFLTVYASTNNLVN